MSTLTAEEEPHATLCAKALQHSVGEFIEFYAPHHDFRDICRAVAETRNLTYDHAVIVVRHRWPQTQPA